MHATGQAGLLWTSPAEAVTLGYFWGQWPGKESEYDHLKARKAWHKCRNPCSNYCLMSVEFEASSLWTLIKGGSLLRYSKPREKCFIGHHPRFLCASGHSQVAPHWGHHLGWPLLLGIGCSSHCPRGSSGAQSRAVELKDWLGTWALSVGRFTVRILTSLCLGASAVSSLCKMGQCI